MTYVNHIVKGTVWKSPVDWASLFGGLSFVAADASADPENMSVQAAYRLPGDRGRLHLRLQHALFSAKPGAQPEEVIRFELTARGPVNEKEPLETGLDLGHDAVVDKFVARTSADAHRFWGYHGNR